MSRGIPVRHAWHLGQGPVRAAGYLIAEGKGQRRGGFYLLLRVVEEGKGYPTRV